jgi:DNA polymerase V
MSPRGGARPGAGRPKGQGKFGETTRPIRIPESMIEQVQRFVQLKGYQLPLYASKVSAGFPSPADDYLEGALDLNEHLIAHPAATFFVRVSGDSMIGAGIHSGDILVVDRSLEATSGRIVVVALDGELTVKRLRVEGREVQLLPENPSYPSIRVHEEHGLHVWGVVTSVIHTF